MEAPCYRDGSEVRIGDRILWGRQPGVVVFVVETKSYSVHFPEREWSYLGSGFMLNVEGVGLVHETKADEDLKLVARIAVDQP
jgi:hypothetical protein